MIESIKITGLNDIGAGNLTPNTVFPVVNMTGTPVTDKGNLQIIGNYILSQAGGANFVQAAQATLAQSVTNAAQPNITSVGTLTTLEVSGNTNLSILNIDVGNLHISGGTNGYVLQTDGAGNLTWTEQTGGAGGLPLSNGNSIIDIATLDGNITLDANGNVYTFGTDGNLTTPSNLVIGANGAGGSSIYQFDAPLQVIGEGANSALIMGWTANSSGPEDVAAIAFNNPLGNGASNLVIGVGNNSTTVNYWSFANDGTTTFPTLTVDLHNGGNQSAQTLQFGDPTQQAIITGPTPDVDVNAQRIIIQGQRGNGTGEGGDVYLWGGDADTNGGDIKIYAGNADNVSAGSGGYVNIEGGSGFDFGGYVSMQGGQCSNGQGAPVSVIGGYGQSGGFANIVGGQGYAGPGGNVTITGGSSGNGLAEYGNVSIGAGASIWTFDNTGNLILAGGNSIVRSVANSSLDPVNPNVSTMVFTPDSGYSSQSLVLDPTAPGHIHLRAPGANIDEPSANIFLGGEDSSFEVGYYTGSAPNLFIHSGNNTWTFGNDGNLTIPGSSGGFIKTVANASIGIAAVDNGTNNPAQVMSLNAGSGAPTTIISTYNTNATIQTNVTGAINTWQFDNAGNLTLPGNTVAINFANGSAAFSNLVQWTTAPVSNTSAGAAGQAAYDSGGNLFVCVSTNTWAKFTGTTSW